MPTHCKGVVTHSTALTSWIFISIHPFLPTVFDRKSHQIANRGYIECQVTFSQTFPFGDLWLQQLLMDSDFFKFLICLQFFSRGNNCRVIGFNLGSGSNSEAPSSLCATWGLGLYISMCVLTLGDNLRQNQTNIGLRCPHSKLLYFLLPISNYF